MTIPDDRLRKGSRREFEKQMMKHMISTFLLWFISKKPKHGYEILQSLESEEGFRVMAASQLYPLLSGLERRGLISKEKALQGRRVRKVYHITEKGLAALKEAKSCMRSSPLKMQFLGEMVG